MSDCSVGPQKLLYDANSLLIEDQLEPALNLYNRVIELDGNLVEAYVKRAACYYALKKFPDAISDANRAIQLDPNSADAYYRKGLSLFAEEEFESAQKAFKKGIEFAENPKKYGLWLRKCEAELGTSDQVLIHQKMDNPLPHPPSEPTIQSSISPVSKKESSSDPCHPNVKYRYDWYQNDSHVTVDVFVRDIQQEQVKVVLMEKQVVMSIQKDPKEEPSVIELNLYRSVSPSESQYVLMPTKVEIHLKKMQMGQWKTLENKSDLASSSSSSNTSIGDGDTHIRCYPSSKGYKDWDAIAASEENDKLQGDAAVNKLFRDIYKGASDEQRRAMMKSYVESGGTVLSTNWEEVEKGEVKGSAPAGMEMHYWKDT